ncbi:MAG: S-adenosylmethionine:tRNA ribosyltransferase-isomerase, partial [Yoonia sp.]
MKLSDFDFDLPEQLIAVRPAKPRSSAKLLVGRGNTIADHHVSDLIDILQAGDVLVLNDTKVIPARLFGLRHRDGEFGMTASKMDVTLLDPRADGTWSAMIKPLRKVQDGEVIVFSDELSATVLGRADG